MQVRLTTENATKVRAAAAGRNCTVPTLVNEIVELWKADFTLKPTKKKRK